MRIIKSSSYSKNYPIPPQHDLHQENPIVSGIDPILVQIALDGMATPSGMAASSAADLWDHFIDGGLWIPATEMHWERVTNRRVILKKGIISRHTEEMFLNSVETVEIRQSIWGRILGYATIMVTGRGVSDLQLKWMQEPLEVKRAIEDNLHQS